MSERLTIIVPAYRVAKYLPECLGSMAAQPDNGFSVLVVDDGSPDESGAIAEAFAARDARFAVLHQANAGVGAARNAGLARAAGEWIWFVDGDDLIAPGAVERLLAAAAPESDMLCFAYRRYPCAAQAKQAATKAAPRVLSSEEIAALRLRNIYPRPGLACANIPVHSASFCLYRRSFLQSNGLQFRTDIPSGQDSMFHLQALRRCTRAAFWDAPLYFYRRNEGSVSTRFNPCITANKLTLQAAYAKVLREDRLANPQTDELLACRAMSAVRQCLCLDFCHAGNPAPYRARRAAFLALMEEPVICDAYADLTVLRASLADRLIYRAIQKKRFFFLNSVYRAYTRFRR